MQTIDQFIDRWANSGGSERANYALFLTELTDVLDLDADPALPPDQQIVLLNREEVLGNKERSK